MSFVVYRCQLIVGIVAFICLLSAGTIAESLIDIYDLAKAHDPQLKANNAALRSAFSDAAVLRSSILPQISANINYSEDDGRQTSRSPISQIYSIDANQTVRFDTEAQNDSYALSINQSLFSLPAIYGARQAKNIRARSTALLAEEQQNLILRVADAYFEVLRSEESLRAAKKTEDAIEVQNNLVLNRFETGLVQATDFLETQVNYDTSIASRIDAETEHHATQQSLQIITGGNSDALWLLQDKFPITLPDPKDAGEWVQIAIQNSYRLRASELALQTAKNALAAKRGAHIPSISASLTRTRSNATSNSYNTESEDERDVQSIGVRMELPIFLGGRLHAERRKAYQEYLQAKAILVQTRSDIVRQIRTIHHRLTTHVPRIRALKRAAQSAERALLSIRSGYETGTREILDVLNAERNLYQTRRNHNHSRIDYLLDTMKLKGQTGILQERDLNAVNDYLQNKNNGARSQLPHTLPKKVRPKP